MVPLQINLPHGFSFLYRFSSHLHSVLRTTGPGYVQLMWHAQNTVKICYCSTRHLTKRRDHFYNRDVNVRLLSVVHCIIMLMTSYNMHCQASYSPDGRYVGAGSADGGVYVWSIEDPDMCTILTGSPKVGPISSIAWSSPQGEIVAADNQGRCTIWK